MKRFRHYKKDKSILISAFGSIEAERHYESFKGYIEEEFSDYDIYMSFSSRTILRYLKTKKGVDYKNQIEAMAHLDMEGYKRQIVLSLNLYPTDEHEYCIKIVEGFKSFSPANIRATKAIFTKTSDTSKILNDISERVREDARNKESLCLYVVHGAPYFEQAGLQAISYTKEFLNSLNSLNYVCALEGAYTFDYMKANLLNSFKKTGIKEITIVPLLLISGTHFSKDVDKMLTKVLEGEGFKVRTANSLEGSGDKFYLLEVLSVRKVIKKHIEEEIAKMG